MAALAERLKNECVALLRCADVVVNGDRPWDIRVNDERLYRRVWTDGTLGLGESYMDGWWDCPQLDQFFEKVLRAELQKKVRRNVALWLRAFLAERVLNPQRRSRAFQIGRRHYDLGNDLFRAMLDRRMVYSCAYWKNAASLDEAQEAKLDLVCRKIGLRPGMRVLDIGGGWGSFGLFAAERYGAETVSVTVSREQAALGRELCAGRPVDIRLQDYRDLNERFDRIVSIGMFEHVGVKNYRTYFRVARRCLEDDGLFLLHTIGSSESGYSGEPWMSRYIFPNSMLPSIAQIGEAIEGLFVMEDWHNFGADYDKTLMAWYENFKRAWPDLRGKYGERFGRMWTYFLLSCAGGFRARYNQVWQIVLSPRGVPGGYESIR
ncbi:MAG: cyclopropane fatty acyl phospholipid synthase [Candidatus Sumerlaeia bacterium]